MSSNENDSCTENPVTVRGDKIKTKNLTNLKVGVQVTDKIGQNFGQLSTTDSWTFGLPHVLSNQQLFFHFLKQKLSCLFSSRFICSNLLVSEIMYFILVM